MSAPSSSTGVTRRELFRLAAEQRLIDDVEEWMSYHQTHNLTAHAYDEDTANDAYRGAVQFLALAKDFVQSLEARNV